jgi:hypothetical protein
MFQRVRQQHSCATKPLSEHFKNKPEAFNLYKKLLSVIKIKVGKYKVISIPCCIHLFGKYDFLVILPKKDGIIEIRIALDRAIKDKRIVNCVPLSSKCYKNCLNINSPADIDSKLIGWIKESYSLNQN